MYRSNFANPYAYRGAKLLAEFDSLVCMALTPRHIGLLGNQSSEDIIKASARKLRSLFTIPQSYRLLKINRELVRTSTGRSQEARKLMGEMPADVLSGARHAPLVPHKWSFHRALSARSNLHPGTPVPETNPSENKNDDG